MISAVNEAREKHPKLAQKLEQYWSEHTTDTEKEKKTKEPEERDENGMVEDYASFVRAKNREELRNIDNR